MSNVLVTDKGMNFVTSAHDRGIYIDIRYFVPVYDDRIDGTVRDSGYNLSSFSQIADPDVTTSTVVGEVLWKRSDLYTIDISNKYIISSTKYPNGIDQKAPVPTNLYKGQPISDQISASSWRFLGSNGSYNVTATNGAVVTGLGNNVTDVNDSTAWTTNSYHAAYDTSDEEKLRGNFSCLFQQSLMGNFKFNKILLFAVAVQKESEIPVDTCLFAEAYMSATQEILNLGPGFDTVELDVQIDISGVSASFEDLFYSSSADYWTHAPALSGKGLHFDGLIGVNSYDDNQKAIAGVMHLRKERAGVGLDIVENIPIIRLDYDNTKFDSIDVDGYRWDVTEATSADGYGTDIIVKVSNWPKYCGDTISIHPDVKSTVALGTSAKPFRELYLENSEFDSEIYSPKNTNNIIPLNVINRKNNYAANFNEGSILIGLSGIPSYTNYFGIRLSAIGIEIDDEKELKTNNGLLGNFKGGDLFRVGQNLLVYNVFCGNASGIEKAIENLYIFAGLDGDANFTPVNGQTGPTHKNIVYAIEQAIPRLFCGVNTKLATTAELHLAAKGKIGLHGPIEIQNLSENARNAILISRTYERNMLIGVGINDSVSFDNLTDRMNNIVTTSNLRTSASSLFLAAHNIYVDGNILPIPRGGQGYNWGSIGDYSVGNYDKYFKKGIFGCIEVGDFDGNIYQRGLRIGCLSSGNITSYGIIKEEDENGNSSYEVQIGKESEEGRIDYGFFKNLNAKSLNFGSMAGDWITVQRISATNVYSQYGFFERGRHTKAMGEWTTVSIPFYTGNFLSYQDIFEDQLNFSKIIACRNRTDNFQIIKPEDLSVKWETKRIRFNSDNEIARIDVKYSIVGKTAFIKVEADFRTVAATGYLRFTTEGDSPDIFNKIPYADIGGEGGPEILYIPTTNFSFRSVSGGQLVDWMSTTVFSSNPVCFQVRIMHIGEGIIFQSGGFTQGIELIWLTPYINNVAKDSYLEIYPTSSYINDNTLITGYITASGQLEIS